MTNFRQQLERTAQKLLSGRAVYILWAEELEARPALTLGFCGRGLDLVYREQLADRWRGRGALIVLSRTTALAETILTHRFGPEKIWQRRLLWLTLAHELAHIGGRTITESETAEDDPAFTQVATEALTAFVADPPTDAIAQPVSWDGHDGPFIRLLFHAAHRIRPYAKTWLPTLAGLTLDNTVCPRAGPISGRH